MIVFVTVTTAQRRPILAAPDTYRVLLDAWAAADRWQVGRYVMMPDHVHLFASPTAVANPLPRWVAYWKSLASRRWPRPAEQPVWHYDFWDTQLRRRESYSRRWEYVLQNPQRAGLVTRAEDWPYAGELHQFRWDTP